ncbi:YcgN family cysteine cluster protein [Muricoccus radiodurans]|uniref:YcgN family cysteine cluster protein n=1 Tax=Muricoccus radiodurans TaxID=2231721 RepID=UPI003CEEAC87
MSDAPPFWKAKPLDALTDAEWESLCDGCGRCCLHKLRDEDTERVHFTNVACRLLDTQSCRCKDYPGRQARVPDCVRLTPEDVRDLDWLPPSCAYRLVADGKDLPDWHPLLTGDPDSVHRAGASVRGRAVPEREAGPLEDHITAWPGRFPRPRRITRREGKTP